MSSKVIGKVVAFTLTFLGYAALHSLREGWSLSKAQIKDIPELKADKTFLGIVDTCYLLSYSFGMMVLGNLINKIDLKYYVGKHFF
jgi:sugar phosphate permease